MNKKMLTWVVAVTIGSIGFLTFSVTSAKSILSNSQEFTLYSLDPDREHDTAGTATFHRYRVVGSVPITDSRLKTELVRRLYQAIDEGERDGVAAACFNPRPGIRAVWLGQSVDVVICFECAQVLFYTGDNRSHRLISSSAQDAFDSALASAGVPRSGK